MRTNLKLNQKILVYSSHAFDNQLIKLEPATVDDVIENGNREEITLNKDGGWGGLPTRLRERVVAKVDELDGYITREFDESEYENETIASIKEKLAEGKVILEVKGLQIQAYYLSSAVSSLKTGSVKEYRARRGYGVLRIINDNVPSNCTNDWNTAVEMLKKSCKAYI
jgi:hypothetical protein